MSSDAAAKNLPTLEYVLYPKLSGLLCILNTLKERRENQLQLSNSDVQYSTSTEVPVMKDGHNILNTISQATNQVDKINALGGKNKEHKADCAQNVPEVNSSVTFHESKDGCQKEKEEKEEKDTDIINNFEKMKKSVGEFLCDKNSNLFQKIDDRSATASATSSKAHRSITALHDLTIAYTDFLPGKKTTHRSILYGKPGYIKPYINALLVNFPILYMLLRFVIIATIITDKVRYFNTKIK